ncbi:hypothetical protein SDC9_85476 [bioreactor metagenome]|uniref:PucR C-terminal helix-turn-helix domain-containing protein n=1 Tax=bioreactor metagenome TaxID=1076179 RepID=A0A644ZDA7_9ZZZZ
MKLELICTALSDFSPRLLGGGAENQISSVRMLTESRCSTPAAELLFVGMLSALYEGKDVRTRGNFLCVEDVPYSYDLPGIALVVVPPGTAPHALVNEVQRILADVSNSTVYWNALLEVALRQGDAQKIVEIASQLFQNPVILSDRSTKLIARAGDFVQGSKLWKDHSEYGYFCYETMQSKNYRRIRQQLDKDTQPILLQREISRYDTINGKILVGNVKIASLSVLNVNRPFRAEDLELLSRLCHVFAYVFNQDSFYKFVRDARRESFFKDLIENKFSDPRRLENRAKSLNLNTEGNYCVLLASPVKWINEKNLLHTRLELETYLPKCYMLISDHHIIAVLDKQQFENPGFQLQALTDYLKANNIKAGISRNMRGLTCLHEQFRQALSARKAGIRLNRADALFEYEQYALYCLFMKAPSHIDLSDFCSPALLRLITYDRENNTEYVKTLYTFLNHNGNYTSSADALFIHRTSLIYRMKKMEETLCLQLSSSKVRNHIYISYLILFVLGELREDFC